MANLESLYGRDKLREAYPKVNRNFNAVDKEVTDLRTRVNNIITTPIDGEAAAQEVVDARNSAAKSKIFDTLDARLEETEQDNASVAQALAAHKAENAPHSGHLKKSGDEMTGLLTLNSSFPLKINGFGGTKPWFIHRTSANDNLIFVTPKEDVVGEYEWAKQIQFSADGSIRFGETPVLIMRGAGSPEGTITARPGSIYLRDDGGVSLYVKATGLGNTGWKAVQVE